MRLFLALTMALGVLQAQDPFTQGLDAYRSGRMGEAAASFQQAVDAASTNINARLYLAAALEAPRLPNRTPSEQQADLQRAEDQLRGVLAIEGNNKTALGMLGKLYFLKAQAAAAEARPALLAQSKNWYELLAQADPLNAEAYFSLGVIAWWPVYQASDKPQGLPAIRPAIEDAIRNFEKATELDPNFADAFAYLASLYSMRGGLASSPEEAKPDLTAANGYLQKALAARGQAARPGDVFPVRAAGPPPPPRARIRVAADVQAAKLVSRVDPVYPPLARQARVQGVVRFTIIVDQQGRVANIQLISGHPLLVASAIEALRQWVYEPTLLNGEPVAVATQVDVAFTLNQ